MITNQIVDQFSPMNARKRHPSHKYIYQLYMIVQKLVTKKINAYIPVILISAMAIQTGLQYVNHVTALHHVRHIYCTH